MGQDEIKDDKISAIPKQRNRKRDIILGLCILLCGMVIGFGVTLGLLKCNRDIRHSLIPRSKKTPEIITDHLTRDLDLTAEQKIKVRKILEQRMKDFKSITHAQFDKTNKEIAKVLTLEQQQKLNKILEERKKKRDTTHTSGSHSHP